MECISTAPDAVPDGELAAQAVEGDQRAFALLYRRHAPVVARRLRRILQRTEDVEDLLQVTFLEVHRSLIRYDPCRPFGAWLHGISFRVVGRYLRSLRRRGWLSIRPPERIEREADGVSASSEDRAMGREFIGRLREAMERLPPKKRIAFALHELEQMGVTEIARMVGASPQTVWARVQSARKEVQKRLGSIDVPSRRRRGPTKDGA